MVWYDAEDLPPGLEIVTRDKWGAKPPILKDHPVPLESLTPPAVKVIYNCTGSKMCWNRKACIDILQYAQWNYMDLGYADILHNFMIGCDGVIYEGRGWLTRPEFTSGKHRNRTLEIAFIGLFLGMSCEPDYPADITVVRREQWGAKPSQKVENEPLRPLRAPVGQVFFNDTASSMCDGMEECSSTLRGIQENHMLLEWPDITHNFMVSGDAVIYEGRGWSVEPDGMDDELKGDVIDIAFIGNYERLMPLPNVISCAEKLVKHGVKLGKIKSDYKIRWLTYYN